MGTADWINMTVLSAHVVGAFIWLTLLALLAGLSWGVYWSRDPALRQGLRAFRGRLLRPVWAVVVVRFFSPLGDLTGPLDCVLTRSRYRAPVLLEARLCLSSHLVSISSARSTYPQIPL